MSAIISLHRFYGVDDNFRASYLVQTVLSGLRNRLGHTSTPKLPLDVHQLRGIFSSYRRSQLNNVCWLAVVVWFRKLLRKSNVVPDSMTDLVLRRHDVTYYEDYVTFTVRTTKTLKKGERPLLGNWKSMAVLFYLSSTYDRKLEIQRHVVQCLCN